MDDTFFDSYRICNLCGEQNEQGEFAWVEVNGDYVWCCRDCFAKLEDNLYGCKDCTHEWRQTGIATHCLNCFSRNIESDQTIKDRWIGEEQAKRRAKYEAIITELKQRKPCIT